MFDDAASTIHQSLSLGRSRRPAGRGAAAGAHAGTPSACRRPTGGKAVQVDTMKPMLKASGTERLKLKCDEPLSDFAFKY